MVWLRQLQACSKGKSSFDCRPSVPCTSPCVSLYLLWCFVTADGLPDALTKHLFAQPLLGSAWGRFVSMSMFTSSSPLVLVATMPHLAPAGQLILPEGLKLLPLATLGLLKTDGFKSEGLVDRRAAWISRCLSAPPMWLRYQVTRARGTIAYYAPTGE